MRTSTLLVVLALPSAAFGQEARVASVRGQVEVTPPDAPVARPAAPGETLSRGVRVATGDDGVARLTLPNGAALTLLPGSQLTLFASPEAPLPGQPPSTVTTLSVGVVRFAPAPGDAAALPLASGATTVEPGASVGVVSATRNAVAVRVSAYQGRVVVRTGGRRVLRAGQGVRESMRPPRAQIVPLVASPTWVQPPPARVTSLGDDGTLPLAFAPVGRVERGGGFRVELARDAGFTELWSSEWLDRHLTRWDAHFHGAGEWYARIFTVDRQGIEGLPSPAVHFTVESPAVVAGAEATADAPGRPAMVRVPAGVFCGLDGAPLTESTTPMRLAPARAHTIRCASAPDGRDVREFTVRPRDAGPLRHEVHIEDTGTNTRMLTLRLADLEGHPLPYATVTATAPDGVALDPIREGFARGVYTASIHWNGQRTRVPLRFTVNGEVSFTVEARTDGDSH